MNRVAHSPFRYIWCFFLPIVALVCLSYTFADLFYYLSTFLYRHLDITTETDVKIVSILQRATTTWLVNFTFCLQLFLPLCVVGTDVG